jgi:putative endonuclease
MAHWRQILGADGERVAERFLRAHHYTILARNYRCPAGEVDLVALDRGTVVFVEVKTRAQLAFGGPADAVDRRKQRQIQRVAEYYLAVHRLLDRNARFDVVAVSVGGDDTRCELLRNAFDAVPRG